MRKNSGRRRPVWKRFFVTAAVLAVLVLFGWWSNVSLQTEEFSFASPRLPEAFSGYRIAVLSDLHGAVFGENNETLLETVAGAEPDMIAVTGDLEDRFRGHDPEWVQNLADGLAKIAPVYYITGNHEWALGDVRTLKKTLKAAGWTVLDNRHTVLERD